MQLGKRFRTKVTDYTEFVSDRNEVGSYIIPNSLATVTKSVATEFRVNVVLRILGLMHSNIGNEEDTE
ncbi:hypothetical protein QE152_g7302 [Popillia japonica]|uniref:Uncharacterized protein n=1 Tax=Popillia japonica TaxID=7064 RepID=A0AAW1MGQ4_POPJA